MTHLGQMSPAIDGTCLASAISVAIALAALIVSIAVVDS